MVLFYSEVTKEGSAAHSGEDRFDSYLNRFIAGWSNLEARQAHYLKVSGSNPLPAIAPRTNGRRVTNKEMCGMIFT